MGYNDNPRRVFGKVNIIYSDSELSMGISVETSGNGEISYPDQVYGAYLTPTIKACTMDGNSTMGGGHQMNGLEMITGWWSDVHCGTDGVFEKPPWIKLNFIERPMLRWWLEGDNKLGQYPVDFNLELYQEDVLVDTREIRGNDKVAVSINYSVPLVSITSIKMVILKWSHPNAKAKLLQYFDIVEEEYLGSELKEFEVLEELCKEGDSGFGINSDTATFTIHNKDRKFDRGYLKSLILLGRKVTPYIGTENEKGEIKYTKFATFYADDWSIPQSDIWIKLQCVDKLSSIQRVIFTGLPYTESVSLYEIAETILTSSGLKTHQYSIDESIKKDIIEKAYLLKGNAWECLQSVCFAGMCNAYINRDDVLVVKKQEVTSKNILIKPSSIISYERHKKTTDFCNCVQVNYTEVMPTTTKIVACENLLVIGAGESVTLTADYSGLIVDSMISFLPSIGIELASFEKGVNAGKFTLKNTSDEVIVTTVKIEGFSLSTRTQSVVASDEESIDTWGKQEYIYEGSDLIQSYSRAEEIATLLLSRMKTGNGNVKISWRGDLALNLQDTFVSEDRYGDTDKCAVEFNQYKFDGGLTQTTRGRLI